MTIYRSEDPRPHVPVSDDGYLGRGRPRVEVIDMAAKPQYTRPPPSDPYT